jgi:hypothetical protein
MELINVDNINSEEEIIAELSNMNGRKNKGRRIILDLISPDEFFGADKFKISKMAILCYKYLKLIFSRGDSSFTVTLTLVMNNFETGLISSKFCKFEWVDNLIKYMMIFYSNKELQGFLDLYNMTSKDWYQVDNKELERIFKI